MKGERSGIARLEFEYEIPCLDAEEMLVSLCAGPVLEKVRYRIVRDGLLWEGGAEKNMVSWRRTIERLATSARGLRRGAKLEAVLPVRSDSA